MNKRIPEPEIMLDPQQVKEYSLLCDRYLSKSYVEVSNILKERMTSSKTSLLGIDVCIGTAGLSVTLIKNLPNCHIVGIDLSDEMLCLAKENVIKTFGELSQIKLLKQDANYIEFSDNHFDFAVSAFSLHHWVCPEKVLLEMYRVVKPNGWIVLVDLVRKEQNLMFSKPIFSCSPLFAQLFENSVKASYTVPEIEEILHSISSTLPSQPTEILEKKLDFYVIWKVTK